MYSIHTWVDGRGKSLINSAKLGEMELGILYAHQRLLEGNGSPVGALTPLRVGVRYIDLDQTCGAVEWISTGTTNTSWKVAYGDTGWRKLDNATYANVAGGVTNSADTTLLWRLTQAGVSISYQVVTDATWVSGSWVAALPDVGGVPVSSFPVVGYGSQSWYYATDTVGGVGGVHTVRMGGVGGANPGRRTGEVTYSPKPGIVWPATLPGVAA